MSLHEPAGWYGERQGPLLRALVPIGDLYGWIVGQRLGRKDGAAPPLPVVCVGNFTVGGAGKTPIALAIATSLSRLGLRPHFLSRGYGGRVTGPYRLDADNDGPSDVGDEPLLLAAAHPTTVARDRVAGAAQIAASNGADVIVMDDGMQNPALAKSLTLAVVDAVRLVGNGHVLPAGPLRAPLDRQLPCVDAIVLNLGDATGGPSASGRRSESALEWAASLRKPVLVARTRPTSSIDTIAGRRLVAFAGIGDPQRFYRMLERMGGCVLDTLSSADHRSPTPQQAAALLRAAKHHDAMLVTTAKDMVRLRHSSGTLAELAASTRPIDIEAVFDARDRDRLATLLAVACLDKCAGRG